LSQKGLMTPRDFRRDIYLSQPVRWRRGRAAWRSDSRQSYEIERGGFDAASKANECIAKRSSQRLPCTTRSSATSRGLFCAGYLQILERKLQSQDRIANERQTVIGANAERKPRSGLCKESKSSLLHLSRSMKFLLVRWRFVFFDLLRTLCPAGAWLEEF
jgi:hypothetical protein